MSEVSEIDEQLSETLALINTSFEEMTPNNTEKVNGNDVRIERHHHNSKSDITRIEPCLEENKGQGDQSDQTRLPLVVVLKACSELQTYVPDDIQHWHQLVAAADTLRGMMGISGDAWHTACQIMGRETAAIVIACMLQRMSHINSPGGYLRSLTAKTEAGKFSPGPMVMALLNTNNAVAA